MGEIQLRAAIKRADDDGDSVRIWGWAAMSVDDLGNPVVDADGEYIPVDILESAVHDAFLRRGGVGAAGVLHTQFAKADLVESFVLTAEKRAAFGFGDGPLGWIVGLVSRDPDVIEQVRSGLLLELSMRGKYRSEPVKFFPGQEREMLKQQPADPANSDGQKTAEVVREMILSDAELLSLVDRGASANKRVRSRVVLIKRDLNLEPTMPPEKKQMAKRTPQMILADLFEQGKLAELAPEEKEALLTALAAMPAPAAAPAPEASEEPPTDMGGEPKADDEAEKAMDEEDEMPKRMDDDMQKREQRERELAKRNQELTERLSVLEKRLGRGELVEMVKRDMAYFPGASVDELADVVESARENLGSERAEKLETMLKSASAAVRDSELFKAAGVRRGGSGSNANNPEGELMELAKRLRQDNPKLSRHESIAAAGRERPDLWARRHER